MAGYVVQSYVLSYRSLGFCDSGFYEFYPNKPQVQTPERIRTILLRVCARQSRLKQVCSARAHIVRRSREWWWCSRRLRATATRPRCRSRRPLWWSSRRLHSAAWALHMRRASTWAACATSRTASGTAATTAASVWAPANYCTFRIPLDLEATLLLNSSGLFVFFVHNEYGFQSIGVRTGCYGYFCLPCMACDGKRDLKITLILIKHNC